jgi:hypothetical protein
MLTGYSHLIRCVAVSLALLGFAVEPRSALAYRPFDGTDAAVAPSGELEVELQPAGAQHEHGTQTLIGPWTVLNIGLSNEWEAVFEGRGETPLSTAGPTELTTAGAFLKHVVVPGSLQDKSGPSVATEFGVLLPDSTGDSGVGASWAGIVSQRWDWGAIHSIQKQRSREIIMWTCSSAASSKDRRSGRCGRSQKCSTRRNSAKKKRFPGWSV